jgi:hypothetical protein
VSYPHDKLLHQTSILTNTMENNSKYDDIQRTRECQNSPTASNTLLRSGSKLIIGNKMETRNA